MSEPKFSFGGSQNQTNRFKAWREKNLRGCTRRLPPPLPWYDHDHSLIVFVNDGFPKLLYKSSKCCYAKRYKIEASVGNSLGMVCYQHDYKLKFYDTQ